MNDTETFHIGLRKKQIEDVDLVLLPGDPKRVSRIAKHLTETELLADLREFHSIKGNFGGRKILITSTGIGGPSAAIAFEELAMLGMKNLRIGTTGAIQEHINPGEIIISTAAVRFDGASRHIAPIEFPAVAHHEIVAALKKAVAAKKLLMHCGITASSDTFYQGQNRLDSFQTGFLLSDIRQRMEDLKALNVLSFEMEAATILTQAAAYGLRAGCVLGVLVNRNRKELPDPKSIQNTEEHVIKVAMNSINFL